MLTVAEKQRSAFAEHICTYACQQLQRSNAMPIAECICTRTREGSQQGVHQHLCRAQALAFFPEAFTGNSERQALL